VKLALLGLIVASSVNAQPAPRMPTIPTVTIGAPAVTGPLEINIVRRYLRRHMNKFQSCYEMLKGTLKAASEIAPSGKVANLGTMGVEGEVAACTKTVLELIEYPRPRDGKRVAVKVDFRLTP